MARRKLSTQGRIVVAGVSVAIGGALAGFMASGDHTANATQPVSSSSSSRSSDDTGSFDNPTGAVPTPANGSNGGPIDQYPQYQQPRPQTRTGGS